MHAASPSAILSPSQLNALARDLLEDTFPLIWVEGELSSVARPGSGHLYCTLKDERAQVRCAMFKPKSSWLKFAPRDGMRVLARGRVTLYEARGDYQLVLDHMEEAGEGALRRAFDVLKARLLAEGLFDSGRKRALPMFARRIGVLTSPTGAAVRDVLSVLARRFPLIEVDVLPVQVQGTSAAAQIRGMLLRALSSQRYDALLITRGGGSLEDLWAFNDEQLTRAIAAAEIPIVSAIGHETDVSLTDFAADVRAPTPSVAAELLVPDRNDLAVRLRASAARLRQLQTQRLQQLQQRGDRAFLRLQASRPQARLRLLRHRQQQAGYRLLRAVHIRLERKQGELRHAQRILRARAPAAQIARLRERVLALRDRPQLALAQRLRADVLRLRGLARSLATVSPLATVARGYAILRHADGRLLRRAQDAHIGETLHARLADGQLQLRVEGDAGTDQ